MKKFFFLFLFPLQSAFAYLYFEDAIFPELVTSGRAMGMGNAFLCKVDDSASAFYNPAGLGSVRTPHLHLTNFHIESNHGLLSSTASGGQSGVENTSKAFNLEKTRQLLLDNRGKMTYGRFQAMPNLVVRFMSLGAMLSTQKRARIGSEDTALFEYSSRQDYGPFWAFNFSLIGGVLKFGVSATYLRRKEIIGEQDRNTPLVLQKTDYQIGKALITTGGARLVFPVMFLPTFSYVIHNAGNTKFSASSGYTAPTDIKQTQDIGFSITPQIGQHTRFHIEFNYKDMSKEFTTVDSGRRLMFGVELDIFRTLFLRGGYGNGFGTGGLGIKTRQLEVDFSTYAVDRSDSASFRDEVDRRYSFTLSLGI